VVTLDHTRAGTRFDASRSLAIAVSYKTLVYGVVAFAVLLAEHLFHGYRAHGQLRPALAEVWAHRDGNVILAKVICVALTFAGYHLYTGIDRWAKGPSGASWAASRSGRERRQDMAPPTRPNILVIWGDDIGISNLSCYSDGLMGYRTPHIDRIAEDTASRAARPGGRPSSWGSAACGRG
jgi:hypothetical protein